MEKFSIPTTSSSNIPTVFDQGYLNLSLSDRFLLDSRTLIILFLQSTLENLQLYILSLPLWHVHLWKPSCFYNLGMSLSRICEQCLWNIIHKVDDIPNSISMGRNLTSVSNLLQVAKLPCVIKRNNNDNKQQEIKKIYGTVRWHKLKWLILISAVRQLSWTSNSMRVATWDFHCCSPSS